MTSPEPAWLASLLQEATVDYPTTPDLAPAVLAAIRAERPAQRAPFALSPGIVMAAVAVLTLGALLAVRGSREAIAGFLGLAVEGEVIEALPTPPAGQPTLALPSPVAIEDIAEPIGLTEAAERLGFQPLLVPGVEPDGAYFILYTPSGWQEVFSKPTLILRYDRFDLWQTTSDGLIGKGLHYDGDAVVESTTVRGQEAYWITGGPRLVTIFTPGGEEIAGSTRTVDANTLVWAVDGRYYRIEGGLEFEEALAIAEGLE